MDGIGVADRSLVSEQARIGRVGRRGWSGNGQNVDTIERALRALRAKRDTTEQRRTERKEVSNYASHHPVRGSDKPASSPIRY